MDPMPETVSKGIGPLNAVLYDKDNQRQLAEMLRSTRGGRMELETETTTFRLVLRPSDGLVIPDDTSSRWLASEEREAEEIIAVNNALRALLGIRLFDPEIDVWSPLR